MKLLCEVQVLNRNTQITKNSRSKSTLAIGYNSSVKNNSINEDKNVKALEILLFTTQNKVGQRYKVYNNIEKIFTKFINDGKATIGFKQPPENLLIKCDPIQLKSFLQTLKLGMEDKKLFNVRLTTAAITAIPQKSQPQNKMTIVNRKDYPTKGFPKTLSILKVSNVQMCKITPSIYQLRYLTSLDLCCNKIEQIPIELGNLSLAIFLLASNELGKTNDWRWLERTPIKMSLKQLDLSNNDLPYFPAQILKCEKMITLRLDNNRILSIPFGLRRLRKLRNFHMSSNELQSIPAIFNNIRLDVLDLWGNSFKENIMATPAELKAVNFVPKLWVMAAQAVCKYKLSYSSATIPWELVDIMSESPVCDCDKLCYDSKIFMRAALVRFTNIRSLVFSRESCIYADTVLCGAKCTGLSRFVG